MENNEKKKCTLNNHINQSNPEESAANFKHQKVNIKSVFKSLSKVENFTRELWDKDRVKIFRLLKNFNMTESQNGTITNSKLKIKLE